MVRAKRSNTWSVLDQDWDESGLLEEAEPAMFSLHFLRSALRQRRYALLLVTTLGLALSAGWLLAGPGGHRASVVLVLAHNPHADPDRVMATNVRLASARPVAQKTVSALRLDERPEDFLNSVIATANTNDILTITLAASSDQEAVRRLTAFTTAYLGFRSEQMIAQSNLQLATINTQIDSLQRQTEDISEQIDTLAGKNMDRQAVLIGVRGKLVDQMRTLQESVQDITMQTASVVAGSRVIDTPAANPSGGKRRFVLGLAPGFIGGGAVGVGIVLFIAVTSERLRRRVDVATALDVPVITSTGGIRPLSRPLRRLPWLRRLDQRRAVDRERMASVIESAIPEPGRGQWLVVGCVDNADEAQFGVVAAAQNLLRKGYVVHLVDLTQAGRLAATVRTLEVRGAAGQLTVSHPRVMAALASDLSDMQTLGVEPGQDFPWRPEDVYLTLTDLSPDTSADHLSSWGDVMVVAVTAGLSAPDRLRTAADRIRAAELTITAAVLLNAEGHDESSGWAPEQLEVSRTAAHLSPV